MHRHELVVDILRESVGHPFCFAILSCEIKFLDRMTIVHSLVMFYPWIVALDSHTVVVIRNGERKDFSVQFLLPPHRSIQLDHTPHSQRCTMRILPVGNVQRFRRSV